MIPMTLRIYPQPLTCNLQHHCHSIQSVSEVVLVIRMPCLGIIGQGWVDQ